MAERELQAEIVRLNKIIEALMSRAERSENLQGSDFNLFHTAVLLEEQVRRRTEELEAALDEKERIEREIEALNRKLMEQSIRDPLTGLYNRRYLDEALERELALARRKSYGVSIVMGDIDRFKSINDTYGHQAGDKVLRGFGELLMRNSRTSDICCRYGGEEFLLVMPDLPEPSACQRAESLRIAVQGNPVMHGNISIGITASFGVASFPSRALDGDKLIAAADEALYQAKEAGRNCVQCSQSKSADRKRRAMG